MGTYTGPADIEANFDPNTINTTWYSNGTQLTGNNIPATCTYDNALVPPTPEARPGYVFNGWKVKAACLIPAGLMNVTGTGAGSSGNQWSVVFDNGINVGTVVGEAVCSQTPGEPNATGTPDTQGTGDTLYCWCRATGYIADGSEQCNFLSSSWVMQLQYGSAGMCGGFCLNECSGGAANRYNYGRYDLAGFRAALFNGLVAQ